MFQSIVENIATSWFSAYQFLPSDEGIILQRCWNYSGRTVRGHLSLNVMKSHLNTNNYNSKIKKTQQYKYLKYTGYIQFAKQNTTIN